MNSKKPTIPIFFRKKRYNLWISLLIKLILEQPGECQVRFRHFHLKYYLDKMIYIYKLSKTISTMKTKTYNKMVSKQQCVSNYNNSHFHFLLWFPWFSYFVSSGVSFWMADFLLGCSSGYPSALPVKACLAALPNLVHTKGCSSSKYLIIGGCPQSV